MISSSSASPAFSCISHRFISRENVLFSLGEQDAAERARRGHFFLININDNSEQPRRGGVNTGEIDKGKDGRAEIREDSRRTVFGREIPVGQRLFFSPFITRCREKFRAGWYSRASARWWNGKRQRTVKTSFLTRVYGTRGLKPPYREITSSNATFLISHSSPLARFTSQRSISRDLRGAAITHAIRSAAKAPCLLLNFSQLRRLSRYLFCPSLSGNV